VARAGGSIYLEPASVITYLDGPPLEWSDMPFYALRWCDEWTLASLHRFRDKWHLTEDAYFTRQYANLGWRRRAEGRRAPRWKRLICSHPRSQHERVAAEIVAQRLLITASMIPS